MEKEDRYTKQIEAYLGRTMDGEARQNFEKALEENEELAEALRDYQYAQAAVEHHLEKELRAKLDHWEQIEKRSYLFPVLAAAAGILLLIAAFFLLKEESVPVLPPKEIARKFYQGPPPMENQAGTLESTWQQAREAYRSGDYAAVTELLAPFANRSPEMNYYLAHSYFQLQDFNASISLFQNLAAGSSIYNYRSEWYLLLSLLSSESHSDLVDQQLNRISNDPDHPFSESAKQLRYYWEASQQTD